VGAEERGLGLLTLKPSRGQTLGGSKLGLNAQYVAQVDCASCSDPWCWRPRLQFFPTRSLTRDVLKRKARGELELTSCQIQYHASRTAQWSQLSFQADRIGR